MRITVTCALLTSLLVASASTMALEPTESEPAGFVPARLERIGEAVERAIADGEIPGAVALIARDGRVVYHRAFGYADIDSRRPMTTDAIFRIASMTKAITSVGVMLLYERGLISLTDDLAEFLPEFAEMQVVAEVDDDGMITSTEPAKRPIRIVDLLTHTAGISYPFIDNALTAGYLEAGVIDGPTSRDLTLAEQMPVLAGQPLLNHPGEAFDYGLGTDVLGRLIEVVSGKPLDQFFADEITGPLGMDDTYFYLPEDKAARLVTLYADTGDLVVSDGTESSIKLDDPNYPVRGARRYFSGGAGLSSTAYDYARFVQMLLNDGELDGVRILGRKSVELMRTARIDWDDDGAADFGLGFYVVGDLGKRSALGSSGMYSWGGAFYTSYWIDPEERLIGVFMSQLRPADSDIQEIFNTLVYQALE